jgi:hypothetical protein
LMMHLVEMRVQSDIVIICFVCVGIV